jgi:hypothetical protein
MPSQHSATSKRSSPTSYHAPNTRCDIGRTRQADHVRPDNYNRKPCGFTINHIGRITPSPTGAILPPALGSGRPIGEAGTAASNKIQFNGDGGLRTYIRSRATVISRHVDRAFDPLRNDTN